jgi:hypothetical protein
MNIVTLYENSDFAMRKALDRYLSQLAGNGGGQVWNLEQVLPGEDTEAVLREKLTQADLILLLVSQDFWASPSCYAQALAALAVCEHNPEKKLIPVLLRPNSIEDTPFAAFPALPATGVCISRYTDPEQGYWDTYQDLKKIINPGHKYQKRPRIAVLKSLIPVWAILLLWSLLALLLPVIHPQEGLRIAAEPLPADADTAIYYHVYRMDNAPQENVVLTFLMETSDLAFTDGAKPIWASLKKEGNMDWEHTQTSLMQDDTEQPDATYYRQCIEANFNPNDAGAYRYVVEFDKPVDAQKLASLREKLFCGHSSCGWSESNCSGVSAFSRLHYFYFSEVRVGLFLLAGLFISLMLTTILKTRKMSSYATGNHQR